MTDAIFGSPPRLIVITDTERAPVEVWLEKLEALAARARARTLMVQLRDRELALRTRRQFGEKLRALTERHGQWLTINDRLDLAVLLDADGVHLGDASVPPESARALGQHYEKRWFVSAACHSIEQISSVEADALLVSPVAAPRKGRAALGLSGFAEAVAVRRQKAPARLLYALGGVTARDARSWLDAGADGVAVSGELLAAPSARELVEALQIAR